MSLQLPSYVDFPNPRKYSEIIDVRSENEYKDDHIPSAINLPVLNNQEREKVGTIYKQISTFEARKLGASLIFHNISHQLKTHFLTQDNNYVPFIYCWRGGQRSNSLGVILSQIGWQVQVLKGGYKSYRHYVNQQLETLPSQFNYKIICGLTGTGKTQILYELKRRNQQILDLEKIANHRGSLLGQEWVGNLESQPSQKYFESLLLQAFQSFDPHQPVWVESESYKIGEVYLPPSLWKKIKESPGIEIQCSLDQRVNFLIQTYSHFIENQDLLKEKIQYLKSRYGLEKIAQWFRWIDEGKWQKFVQDLLVTHYDPAYRRSLTKIYPRMTQTLDLSDQDYDKICDRLT